ncbi:hypothetical protein CLIB1423_08S00936 [[Candida] railenensis]|uniref:LMBR1-like membrane protein n=1 Tax=[Candida] railenensis TaxID=45579 RepID=A0A9P0VY99_9ASCO|nr:hypothetical protein CLIB1423_08S00936 [[Candida] railenensis]
MWVAPLLGYIIILITTVYGVQYHINIFRGYPVYLSVPLTLAVYLPISIVILLPLDYVSHNTTSSSLSSWFSLPDSLILYLWKTAYWTTFILTWLMLPILQEFYRSGHFHAMSKLKDALRRNLKHQAIMLGVGIFGFIYLLLEVGITFDHVKLMIIAATHIYSLCIVLWLMSHGLVSIPRNRWIAGNNMINLNHYYMQLPVKKDLLEDTKISFKEDVLKVLVLVKNFTSTSSIEDLRWRDWILELSNSIPIDIRNTMERQLSSDPSLSHVITRDQINEKFFLELTSSYRQNLWKMTAYESEVNVLMEKIFQLVEITGAPGASNDGLIGTNGRRRNQFVTSVKPILNRILSVLLYLFSFIVIESEFLHSTRFSLINVLLFHTGIQLSPTLQLFSTTVIFSYMLFASLNSLTRLKIFNMYHLVPHKSDPVSACFYATYIARLTIPLSYNFITLFISRNSIFESWFGASLGLDRAGIFNLMNNWLPRLILIPIVLTVFNVYDKVKKLLGMNDSGWIFDEDEDDEEYGVNGGASSNERLIAEGIRITKSEQLKRAVNANSEQNRLRQFNLNSVADTNYENNLQTFNQSLANRLEYRDSEESVREPLSSVPAAPNQDFFRMGAVWGTIGGVVSGVRDTVASRFGGNNFRSYRDDPESIENFDYDNDNLVI